MIPKNQKPLLIVLSFLFCVAVALQARATPQLTVSPARVQHKAHVAVHGTGFSPKSNVLSHLRRPDGTEFPVLPILTDAHGEFTHDIDTLLLQVGTHELWVVDSASGVTSNIAHFEVFLDPHPRQ